MIIQPSCCLVLDAPEIGSLYINTYTKCKKSNPGESIQPFGKIHCKNLYCCPGEWWRNVAGGGHRRTDQATGRRRGWKKSKRTKCLLDIPKEKTVILTFFNQLYISVFRTFPHLVTCQPTDGRADLVALTFAFPAVFQNFSAEDLHNLIHQLFVCKHVYLRLWGQGEPTKTPSYLCLEDSWRKGRAGSLWGTPTAPNKQTLSHASRNIRNATYVVGNFKSHFKFVYVTEELN